MSYLFFIGTQASVIKMWPVIKEFELRKVNFRVICSGQHTRAVMALLKALSLPKPEFLSFENVSSLRETITWQLRCLPESISLRCRIKRCKPLVVVHGDDLSTLMGAFLAKSAGAKLAHVEAGVRTSFFEPFPESFNRVIVDHLSDLLFAPGEEACSCLIKEGKSAEIIDTKANTVLDSLRLAVGNCSFESHSNPEPYAVSTVHRFENLYSAKRLRKLIEIFKIVSGEIRTILFAHPSTLRSKLKNLTGVEIRPLTVYPEFARLVSGAAFVLTDSSGLQQESFYMGKPCLMLCKNVAFKRGLNENVLLSNLEMERVNYFLENRENFKVNNPLMNREEFQPSEIVVNSLLKV